jgi:hypothetical protein
VSCRKEAKSVGLAVVIWSYPRGGKLDKAGETALDICAYAAHIAALLGAHIIKVKPPTNVLWQPEAKAAYEKAKIDISTMAARIKHVMQATFNGKRIVVFSGGEAKDLDGLFTEIRSHPRRRRQRLDHRPQHLPAPARRRARHARQDHLDLSGQDVKQAEIEILQGRWVTSG